MSDTGKGPSTASENGGNRTSESGRTAEGRTVKVSLDGKNYDLSWDTVLALRSAGYEVRRATPQSADQMNIQGSEQVTDL